MQSAISSIGDGNLIIDKSADISFKSRSGGYEFMLSTFVVPTITDYQLDICGNVSDWKIPQNIQLADPEFDRSSRMDMLIGAELFFDLMCVGQIKRTDNKPVLQKSLLGWVVAIGSTRPHCAA